MKKDNIQEGHRIQEYRQQQKNKTIKRIVGLGSTLIVLLIAFGVFRFFSGEVTDESKQDKSTLVANIDNQPENDNSGKDEQQSTVHKEKEETTSDVHIVSESDTQDESMSEQDNAEVSQNAASTTESASTAASSQDSTAADQTEKDQDPADRPVSVSIDDPEFEKIFAKMSDKEKACALIITSPEVFDRPGDSTSSLDEYITGNLTKSPVCGLVFDEKNITYYEQFKSLVDDTYSLSNSFPMKMFMMMNGDEDEDWMSYLRSNLINGEFNTSTEILAAYGINLYCSQNLSQFDKKNKDSLKEYTNNNILFSAGLVYSKNLKKELEQVETAIQNGASIVMLSNNSSSLNEDLPVSMSESVIHEIRSIDNGIDVVIMTDAMNRKSITNKYESGEAAINALKAGADIVLLPDDFNKTVESIEKALHNNELSEDQIKQSLYRIYSLKKKLK